MSSVQTIAVQQNNAITMQTSAGADQYLTFILAGEEYGIDILSVD